MICYDTNDGSVVMMMMTMIIGGQAGLEEKHDVLLATLHDHELNVDRHANTSPHLGSSFYLLSTS